MDRIAPRSDIALCDGIPVAIALLAEGGRIERATSGFVDRFDVGDGSLAACATDADTIAAGEADRLTVQIDGVEADLAAVVDAQGRRTVVLTVPTAGDAAEVEAASPFSDEPLDESPAIIWLKDLDGRYLRVNQRYLEQVGAEAEEVCGLTDAELTAARSIEGLRLEDRDPDWQEPLELEYYVGAFEERPAFAVLRFAVRDRDGQPTATCSVAAPDGKASLARSECERLMKIDRWGRLDAFAIRQELLEQWGLTVADGSTGPPLDRDDRVAAALAERDDARAAVATLEEELRAEREQHGSLRSESELAAERAIELDGAVAAERTRSAELEQSLAAGQSRVAELEAELTALRAELEEHHVSGDRITTALGERDEALSKVARLEQELAGERDEALSKAARLEQELAGERDEALSKVAQLEQELAGEREQHGTLRAESEEAAGRAKELDDAVATERTRSAELQESLARTETRVAELGDELAAAQAELGEHRATEHTEAAAPASHADGPAWSTDAQRALSAALVGQTEWRSMLNRAVDALGSAGGWDATIAWAPDGPRGAMRCGAMWKRDPARLSRFETRVWQQQKDVSTAEFGRARSRMATTCLLELESAEDPLLRAAAEEGMGSALLMPITSGGETIAILELLASTSTAPNAELTVSLDAIALQLSAIAQLIKFADAPRWRTGRL